MDREGRERLLRLSSREHWGSADRLMLGRREAELGRKRRKAGSMSVLFGSTTVQQSAFERAGLEWRGNHMAVLQ